MMKQPLLLAAALVLTTFAACIEIPELFPGGNKPLTEQVLSGEAYVNKLLVINLDGTISENSISGFLTSSPSVMEDFIMQLEQARKDPAIKGVLIKINSPGGTVTASDIIYREIQKYKEETKNPVYVSMMSLAASGGYYVSLAADSIFAHPTTITGSIGVIMMTPNFSQLMMTLGVQMNVYKSGENKDAGSPFRRTTKADDKILNSLIMEDAERFWALVRENRTVSDENFELVKSARVFSAAQAQKIGLIDQIGYVDDALNALTKAANMNHAQVVTYRRQVFANDNIYNTRMSAQGSGEMKMVDLGAMEKVFATQTGCYYLWLPGAE